VVLPWHVERDENHLFYAAKRTTVLPTVGLHPGNAGYLQQFAPVQIIAARTPTATPAELTFNGRPLAAAA